MTTPLASAASNVETGSNRPLGIAICLAHFHPMVGGAERQMRQLAARWSEWGHRPIVFTRAVAGLPEVESLDGFEIRRAIRVWDRGPMFGTTFLASLALELWRARRRYDVILAAQSKWEAVCSGYVSSMTGKPSLARVASVGPRGDVAELSGARGAIIWRRLFLRNARFVAPSEFARDELLAFGCDTSRIERMTNGVDLTAPPAPRDAPAERERTALFVGRLATAKDPLAALRAWRLANGHGKWRLLIAGDGPLRAEMESFVARRSLAGVQFLGSRDDMRAIYPRAAVQLQTSPHEGCSNALLEGMAAGLCAVATAAPGNDNIIVDGENGLTAAVGDDEALARAIVRAFEDEALRQRLAHAARDHVERHHDLDALARRYLTLFEEMFARRSWRKRGHGRELTAV